MCALLIILVTAVSPTIARPEADSLFARTMVRLGDAPIEAIIDSLKQVIRLDRDHDRAHYELARLYMRFDNPVDRQTASRYIRRALYLDSDNEAYQLALGDLYWMQDFRKRASSQYEKIYKRNPRNASAAFWIGRRALWEYLNYRYARGAYLYLVKKDEEKAREYLWKAIRANPELHDAYYYLGLVELESGHPDRLVSISRRLLQQDPNSTDALLYCGLGYQRQGGEKEAKLFYLEAIQRMPPEERRVMEDVSTIAIGRETVPAPDDSTALAHFWRKQDPLLLTDYSERRMAHYGRVAYANLRFGRPEKNIQGWKTAKGKSWIKFGTPLWVRGIPPASKINPASKGAVFSVSIQKEDWYYEDFQIRFDTWDSQNWDFGSFGMGEAVGLLSAGRHVDSGQNVFRKTPSRYLDPFRHQKYSTPTLWTTFRRGDSVRVEVSYALPESRIKHEGNGRGMKLDQGVFLLDETWNQVYRRVIPVPEWQPLAQDSLRAEYIVGGDTFTAAPGIYTTILEVGDRQGGAIAVNRQPADLGYPNSDLALSDLLLATRVSSNTPFPQGRADLDITPNPLRSYPRTDRVHVYFEIYNLARDTFGRTHYEIAYQVRPATEKEVDPSLFVPIEFAQPATLTIRRSLLGVEEQDERDPLSNAPYEVIYQVGDRNRLTDQIRRLSVAGRPTETAVAAEYEGQTSDDFTFLRIDVSALPPGIHRLAVTLRDMLEQRTATREEFFRVY